MAIVRRIAAIRSDPTVEDAGLCHGAAGVLHIFNRIHQATADPGARDTAIHWAERTLALRAGPRLAGVIAAPTAQRGRRGVARSGVAGGSGRRSETT